MRQEEINALKTLVDLTRHSANVRLDLPDGIIKVGTCSKENLYNCSYSSRKRDEYMIGEEWTKIESFLLSI